MTERIKTLTELTLSGQMYADTVKTTYCILLGETVENNSIHRRRRRRIFDGATFQG